MSEDCIFCQIVAGKASSHKVYEDEDTFAFMDIFPIGEGHVLVVPKSHSPNLFEITEGSMLAVSKTSNKIAEAMNQVLNPDGLTVAQLNGAAAGQTVFHYHIHLIPRQEGDPIDLRSRGRADDEHLAEIAKNIAAVLHP